MSQPVIIKSNRYGINLILDETMSFEELKAGAIQKFKESEKFFQNTTMAISFEGKKLSSQQEIELIEAISDKVSIQFACILENDEIKENFIRGQIEQCRGPYTTVPTAKASITDENLGQIYRGTMRSGAVLESDASIIVIGDVNPGATVISNGNIVILGALKGTAYAGNSGDNSCFVAALDMNPLQIKIGDVIGRSEDKGILSALKERRKHTTTEPQVASVANNQILIEPISKNTFQKL